MTKIPNIFKAHNIHNMRMCLTPDEVMAALKSVYHTNVSRLQKAVDRIATQDAEAEVTKLVQEATYPFLGFEVPSAKLNTDARLSYGAVTEAGTYGTTLTRPDLFEDYYYEQTQLLMDHHQAPMFVGESSIPIPLPFGIKSDQASVSPEHIGLAQQKFVLPNLSTIDDEIVNSGVSDTNALRPLALFTAERVDLSLQRLHHYTGTSVEHFQRFILLTNYQRYVDAFIEYGLNKLKESEEYEALVEPGDFATYNTLHTSRLPDGERAPHLPQMPAYHLTRPDKNGITFINIGVGSSNAKTMTDHLAVLRPHCWLMLGHCAGLRRSQLLGDYVLAHAYVRADHVLDEDLPVWVPIPPIAEVQVALEKAVAKVTGQYGWELKSRMRTGTVFSTDNRNWEFRFRELSSRFQQSRAMAVDMESATVAANGFRFRVPYGTLLCVSDKPIHGEIKLRGMANAFYRQRVSQHLEIGLEAINILRQEGHSLLHSRKLRGFDDPPFR